MSSANTITKLHRLLERQLRKVDKTKDIDKDWADFIQQVNQAYINFDEQHWQLERILELSGNELFKANEKLNTSKQELEKIILNRTEQLRKINQQLSEEIIERKAMEEELKVAIANADKANRSKTFFLSNMSHEIRTPMHAIVGLTELALQESLNPSLQEKLKSIKFAGENLKIILDDILDFSKIEAGKLKLEKVQFSLSSLLNNLLQTITHLGKDKPIIITLDCDPLLPTTLIGDPTRVLQILTNLGANAVKFTKEGSVKIHVFLAHKIGQDAHIKFKITDTGIGIPSNRLESIFESFEQADDKITRHFGGSGLGLSICNLLVEMLGGKISVKSQEGIGSEFLVSLPFIIDELVPDKNNSVEKPNEMISLGHLRILLVEDNKINQFLADQILRKWEIVPVIVENGKEAIEIVQEREFDIILMDLQMPEMDGFEAVTFIRNNSKVVKNPKVIIIALTADAFPETKEKVIKTGMNDYISKPFSQIDLRNKIVQAMENIR
jgi:signal transduction histidine kinase/CheY-like chemotaxis protein